MLTVNALAAADGVLVFEEFTLQRCLGLLAFGAGKPSASALSGFISRFHAAYPALPVFVDIDAGTAAARAAARPDGLSDRMRNLTPRVRESIYRVQQQVLEDMRGLLTDYECVDASLPLDEQCGHLESRLGVAAEASGGG